MPCWIRCWQAGRRERRFRGWKFLRRWEQRASPPGPPNLPCKPELMVVEDRSAAQEARGAPLESIAALLASASEEVLDALIANPSLDETHVCLLLERKDLPGSLLEEIAKRKSWRASYRVRRALASHPHTPRLIAKRLLRDLHLMDLVRIALLPASTGELRRLAEEGALAHLRH